MTHVSRSLAALLFVAAAHGLPGTARAVDVTTCGQKIPKGAVAVLQADLDCSGPGTCVAHPGTPCGNDIDCVSGGCDLGAVTLASGTTLQMNGHAIVSSGARYGVFCATAGGKCTVTGPGDISGGVVGIESAATRTVATNVTIHDVVPDFSQVGYAGGIQSMHTVVATGVTVSQAYIGIFAQTIRATNVTATGNSNGGLVGYSPGFPKGLVTGKAVTVTGNGGPYGGVASTRRCKLVDSTVTGNFAGAPSDIAANKRPSVKNTTCDHSRVLDGSGTWGVCALD